jgi:thiamine-phosphate pyrophosphorylase
LNSQFPPLICIVDADVARRIGWTVADLAASFIDGGATLLQLRAKSAPSGEFLEAAVAIAARAHQAGARLVINDRADIARQSGADGVHIGQDDLQATLVRALVGADAIIGLSTHTDAQLQAALEQPVDYVATGPVFGTTTKATGYDSIGLESVRRSAALARGSGRPLVAIGGITLDTAPDVLGAGASAVAVITDLVAGGDPAARVRAYLTRLTV